MSRSYEPADQTDWYDRPDGRGASSRMPPMDQAPAERAAWNAAATQGLRAMAAQLEPPDRRCATCGANLEVGYCAIDCPQHIDHFEAPGHE